MSKKKNKSTSNDQAMLAAAYFGSMVSLMEKAIDAEERMLAMVIGAQKGMLSVALEGAEGCPPENFKILVDTIKEVSIAGIDAQREVYVTQAKGGKAAISAFEKVAMEAIAKASKVEMKRIKNNPTRCIRMQAHSNAPKNYAEREEAEEMEAGLGVLKAMAPMRDCSSDVE